MSLAEVTVERLGARGDGIARHEGRPLYVPFTVPGDRARVRLGPSRGGGAGAALVELVAPGPGRADPRCRHFGRCGGCALQHLGDALYEATKRGQVVEALARQGMGAAAVAPLLRLPAQARRRARLTLDHARNGAARAGFQARGSHSVEDMRECHVLLPPLFALVAPLRGLAAALLPRGGSGGAAMTAAETGVDLVLDLPKAPDLAGLEALAAFAERHDLARLSWRAGGETLPVAQRRAVRVVLAGVPVELPPDAFLQATREAEAALARAVLDGIAGARRVADLFAGIGTFAFPIAATGAAVHAVEGARPALDALRAAANRAMLPRVTTELRDLDARPLEAPELSSFDAVVFDPPRAGARAQAEALAAADVPRVVAVSCSPATFARDAAALVAGGYRLERVLPVDQFVWSSHVELVGTFQRAKPG